MSLERREARAAALRAHVLGRKDLGLPREARELHGQIRKHLLEASNEQLLTTSPHEIYQYLKLTPPAQGKAAEFMELCGGEADFKRTGTQQRFIRADGAWFHFSMTVRERRGEPLELVAYSFQLCFGQGQQPGFLRFDMNQPDVASHIHEPRCHLHPGHDALRTPTPLLSPLEILDWLVAGPGQGTGDADTDA